MSRSELDKGTINPAYMFTNITWSTYFSYAALVCVTWYIFVAIRYYRTEISAIALRISRRHPQPEAIQSEIAGAPVTAAGQTTDNALADLDTDRLVAEVEALSSKLEEAVRESSSKGYSREEFLFVLQLLLKEFPSLDIPRCHVAVQTLITSECEKYSYLVLGDEELAQLWKLPTP